MEMDKLTAKLRDAVPVCLMVEGEEIKRYKNIEIPDELKVLEYKDFKFDVPAHGAITFTTMFASGVLPDVFPQARERRSQMPVGDAPFADVVLEAQEDGQPGDTTAELVANDDLIEEEGTGEASHDTNLTPVKPAIMEIAYHVTGERRKELVKAVSQITGMSATYQNAPTFAFAIGDYTVDKKGTLAGAYNAALVAELAGRGFIAE